MPHMWEPPPPPPPPPRGLKVSNSYSVMFRGKSILICSLSIIEMFMKMLHFCQKRPFLSTMLWYQPRALCTLQISFEGKVSWFETCLYIKMFMFPSYQWYWSQSPLRTSHCRRLDDQIKILRIFQRIYQCHQLLNLVLTHNFFYS